jgi:sulfur-carrier protein adenylyltransferase/sulfurtransferase
MQEITVQDLKKKIENKEEFQLIDVREPHEYEVANIGGELIPLSTILDNVDRISHDKPVIFYCRSGARSASAVHALEKQLGYKNLYNLKGGILAWIREIDPSLPSH